ncbi:MAG: hypothetical protein Q7J45_03925 [bacterium]|nr:hypothetical protein [bacterium]
MVPTKGTPKEAVVAIIEGYECRLRGAGIPKNKMDPRRTCESLNMFEILAHAHYLCDGVKEFAGNPRKQRKMGSHLAAVQMFLSFAGWYTLQELMDHNRPLEG